MKVVSVPVRRPGSTPEGIDLFEARTYLTVSMMRWLWEALFSFKGMVFLGELENLQEECEAARDHPAFANTQLAHVLQLMLDIISYARRGYDELSVDQTLRVRMVFCDKFIELAEQMLHWVIEASEDAPRSERAKEWLAESRSYFESMPRDLLRLPHSDVPIDLDPDGRLTEFWLGDAKCHLIAETTEATPMTVRSSSA
jgi:hypothetical protein